jgi:hypothetical protein
MSLLLISRSNPVPPDEVATSLDVAKADSGDGSETAAHEQHLGALDDLFGEIGELQARLSRAMH